MDTQTPVTENVVENPDTKYRANGGSITHTKLSLQEKQEARRELHRRKINSKIAKSMTKHHRMVRHRMRVATAETAAINRSERAHQRELKKTEKRLKEAQALANSQNQIFFKAYNLKTPQEQAVYLKVRSLWAERSVQQLIDAGVITESQRAAALSSITVQ
jgi:hypothetical protein